MRIEAAIFDFGRTLYDPEVGALFPETENTLEALKERGLKMGLVTVAETEDTQRRIDELTQLGLTPFFQAIDVVGRNTEGKDFTRILGEFDLLKTPQACVIVGDNLKREITAGNKIGAYTVWTKQKLSADWKPENEEQTPRATINNLSELAPLIDHIQSQ